MHSSLLQLPESSWIASNELAFAVRAPNPVLPGARDRCAAALRVFVLPHIARRTSRPLGPGRRPEAHGRAAETAFVLTRATPDEPWRYCGVGRWLEDDGAWRLPDLDFATWRALGKGRDCSRRLPADATRRAGELLDELWGRVGAGAWVEHDGKRCRLVARLARGVRVDGGEGGFAARQVSVTDVAWVMLAAEDVARTGGVLDEARVNRLRYLAGTPKESTRWIDTGWAILLLAAGAKPSGD
jgi:hypothetical protein